MSSKIQITTLKVLNGEVIATEKSDKLDIDLVDMLATLRANAMEDKRVWDTVNTPDGVIKSYKSGLIEIYSCKLILDPETLAEIRAEKAELRSRED